MNVSYRSERSIYPLLYSGNSERLLALSFQGLLCGVDFAVLVISFKQMRPKIREILTPSKSSGW